jgi:hypothetical protein
VEKRDGYRALVKQVVADQANYRPSHGEIEPVIVFDEGHDRYLLLNIGWRGPRHVHGVILHLPLVAGTIRVEVDGTPPPGAAAELIEAGVPREAIVLAFQSQRPRAASGSAATRSRDGHSGHRQGQSQVVGCAGLLEWTSDGTNHPAGPCGTRFAARPGRADGAIQPWPDAGHGRLR